MQYINIAFQPIFTPRNWSTAQDHQYMVESWGIDPHAPLEEALTRVKDSQEKIRGLVTLAFEGLEVLDPACLTVGEKLIALQRVIVENLPASASTLGLIEALHTCRFADQERARLQLDASSGSGTRIMYPLIQLSNRMATSVSKLADALEEVIPGYRGADTPIGDSTWDQVSVKTPSAPAQSVAPITTAMEKVPQGSGKRGEGWHNQTPAPFCVILADTTTADDETETFECNRIINVLARDEFEAKETAGRSFTREGGYYSVVALRAENLESLAGALRAAKLSEDNPVVDPYC